MTLYGGGYEQGENSGNGALTVTARISNGASRHAMPTIPELVYAALLYPDNERPESPPSKDFVEGTAGENGKLVFSFQKPDDTNGEFTLEVFAFVKAEGGTTNFSRNSAPFSKAEPELTITGDTINVGDIALEVNDLPDLTGTVSLKIKVPNGCTIEIDDTTHFAITGTSPNLTLKQKDENGISAGAYQVTFTVKKAVNESDEIVNVFSEYINVINGLCTDTWWNGSVSSEAKEITQSMISSTVYVRGSGGWYDATSPYNNGETATASDDNLGSFLSPLATIQKAVDKIIAINDGASAYTIYVDGTLTQSAAASANSMADFSALGKNLTLTIQSLSGTATLDANGKSRVLYAKPASGALNLTLENLVITGGNTTGNGGGIYYQSTGGILTVKGGTIAGNIASNNGGGVYVYSGMFTMEGGEISECTASTNGGGVYVYSGMFTMEGGEISNCTAESYGGGVYIYSSGTFNMSGTAKIAGCTATSTASSAGGGIYSLGTFNLKGGTIGGTTPAEANKAVRGGGVYVYTGTFTMEGGTISNCTASSFGGGVYIYSSGTFNMSGTAKITGCKTTSTNTSTGGGGVYVAGTFTMEGGTISDNTSPNGGGVFVDSSTSNFTMGGGTISGNTASLYGGGVYVSSGTFAMTSGTISGNSATNGNGAYLAATGKLNMSDAAQFAESDDVYLYASGSNIPTITVAGALAATSSPVATITPSAYTAGRQVLSAGSGVTIDDTICGKFAVSQEGWEIAANDDGTAGVLGISVYLNSSSGDDANSGLTASKAVKTLSKAIELFESQGAQKIMVCAEYTLPSEESTLLDRAGKEHLTLMRYTGSSDVSSAFTGKLLTISQGNVTITNVTLDGTIKSYNTDSLLYISGSGTEVTLGDDAVICNNSDSGVCVSSYNSKFKMTGGAITGNSTSFGGGGVKISSGTFEMSGGIISGNNGGSYGGGVDVGTKSGCKFTMSGGEISGNYARRGAGVNVSTGVYTGTFEMSGGTISGNQSYGTGDSDGGGGVYVSGKFIMSGGEITGNTATTNGGGVLVKEGGTFTQGGTVSGNTPDEVYLAP